VTKIIYDRQGPSLSMEGHALSGKIGEDIICAAESMLLMCLEKRLMDLGEDVMLTMRRAPGRAYVAANAVGEAEKLCRAAFETVFSGFMLLAEYEPEHVSIEQRGDSEERGEEEWN